MLLDSQQAVSATPSRIPSPSLPEVLGLVLASYALFLFVLHLLGGSLLWLANGHSGDTPAYLQAASAIRQWNFAGVDVKQFWGLPYAIAGVSLLTGMPELWAMLIVCLGASVVSIVL